MGSSPNNIRLAPWQTPVLAVVMACAWLMLPGVVQAQVADSTEAGPVLADSLSVPRLGAGFPQDDRGLDTDFGRPVRRAAIGLASLLETQTGMMPYSFGAAGWPSTFSPFGLDPNRTELVLDGRLMDDLVTGRPRYDLLPYALVDSIRLDPSAAGHPFGVRAGLVAYATTQPETDLRYSSSATGLQSVDAIHTQSRPFTLFAPDDRIQILFGYAGAASDGEYPGSRLRRARQIQARIRFERPTWSLELYELTNRRHVGAHDGVLTRTGQSYTSIYQRLGATVGHPEAKRTTVRNDLSLRFRTLSLIFPLTITGFWTTQTLQYRASADTVTARVGRTGLSAETELHAGSSALSVSFTTWLDRYRSGNAFQNGFDTETGYIAVESRGRTRIGRLALDGQIGFHTDAGNAFSSVALNAGYGVLSLRASSTGLRSNWLERAGFGSNSAPLQQTPEARLHRFSISFFRTFGPFGVALTGFHHVTDGTTAWRFDPAANMRTAEEVPGTLSTTGLAAELAFRSSRDLGLYGLMRPTVLSTSSAGISPAAEAEQAAVPDFFLYGRLGVHMLLFQRDLDLDLSARLRYWEPMAGRRLDPHTGLLMLPMTDQEVVPASWTLDVVAEANVRTATLFVALDNIFSGTNIMVGNLLIPDYPLPAQRFRFGVFWPIKD